MSLQQHCESLRRKHALIENNLREEEKHLWQNERKIHKLKLEKLHLKEQIARLGPTEAA